MDASGRAPRPNDEGNTLKKLLNRKAGVACAAALITLGAAGSAGPVDAAAPQGPQGGAIVQWHPPLYPSPSSHYWVGTCHYWWGSIAYCVAP